MRTRSTTPGRRAAIGLHDRARRCSESPNPAPTERPKPTERSTQGSAGTYLELPRRSRRRCWSDSSLTHQLGSQRYGVWALIGSLIPSSSSSSWVRQCHRVLRRPAPRTRGRRPGRGNDQHIVRDSFGARSNCVRWRSPSSRSSFPTSPRTCSACAGRRAAIRRPDSHRLFRRGEISQIWSTRSLSGPAGTGSRSFPRSGSSARPPTQRLRCARNWCSPRHRPVLAGRA